MSEDVNKSTNTSVTDSAVPNIVDILNIPQNGIVKNSMDTPPAITLPEKIVQITTKED